MELALIKEHSLRWDAVLSKSTMAEDVKQSSVSIQNYRTNQVSLSGNSTRPSNAASKTEGRQGEMFLSLSTGQDPGTSQILNAGTEGSSTTYSNQCSVPVYDGGSRYLFHRRLPTAIGHRILQESGLREWTMVKRVSRFHSAEVSRFMDARLLQLLKIYIEDAGALVRMLTRTKSMIAGQFVLHFLNVSVGASVTCTPLLIFAPSNSRTLWSDIMSTMTFDGVQDNVPLVFEDYCMHYMKFHGKQGSRVRILFSKTGSGFPMILGFGDTLGCCFVNGRGLYVGYPDDVTEKKVVIGHTGPYAMPPLHGRREFRTSSVVNDVAKTADCGWHCNGLWRTFMDAGSARHLWYNEMVEDEQLDKEVDYWRWNTGSPCKNSKCPRYNVRTDYRASVYL
ncbi:hypothetical protein F5051DRAFT_419059 [Lentinula edodes]|nr:hypothetical protein F5051DRAFT_419059 [Lentinula edodes]